MEENGVPDEEMTRQRMNSPQRCKYIIVPGLGSTNVKVGDSESFVSTRFIRTMLIFSRRLYNE